MSRGSFLLLASLSAGCIVIPKPATTDSTSTPNTGPVDPPETTTPSSGEIVDIFLQQVVPMADVLLVVQNTPGMADAQDALANEIPILLDSFLGSGVDWHIGVVSTDLDDPATAGVLIETDGLRWLDAEVPDPLSVLGGMVSLGEAGSLTVQPMGAAYEALEKQRYQANAGFYREEASLSVIVLSDGTDVTDATHVTEADFLSWMGALKTGSTPSYSCLLAGTGTACGDLSAQVGGRVADVTDSSIYDVLAFDAVGRDFIYPLSVLPLPDSIEVTVLDPGGAILVFEPAELDAAGNVVDGDWTYNPASNTVAFLEYVPSEGAEIHVSYDPLAP